MNRFRVLDPNIPTQELRGLCALAVMTKAPQAGQVKTRLVPPLKPEEAAELNKSFLRDTAAAISDAATAKDAACGIAVYTPVGAEPVYAEILPANFSLIPQRGDQFGERLYFAALDLFKCGFASVCLIDSDSPTVPTENFAQAVTILQCSDDRVVLGPCDDGGYYLIGLKKPHKELFERIDWSTEHVLDQTRQRAREICLAVKLLPTGYDVDDEASLWRLCNELLAGKQSDSVAPRTRKFLRDIIAREGRTRIWPHI
jgi:rSAM/selenodomain-associated transferase 1